MSKQTTKRKKGITVKNVLEMLKRVPPETLMYYWDTDTCEGHYLATMLTITNDGVFLN